MTDHFHYLASLDNDWDISNWLSTYGTVYASPLFKNHDHASYDNYYTDPGNAANCPTFLVHFDNSDILAAVFLVDAARPHIYARALTPQSSLMSYVSGHIIPYIEVDGEKLSPDVALLTTQYAQTGGLTTDTTPSPNSTLLDNSQDYPDFNTVTAAYTLQNIRRKLNIDRPHMKDKHKSSIPDYCGVLVGDCRVPAPNRPPLAIVGDHTKPQTITTHRVEQPTTDIPYDS